MDVCINYRCEYIQTGGYAMADKKIIQICPARDDMRVNVTTSGSSYTEEKVVCLALMEYPDGSRAVEPIIITSTEIRLQEVLAPEQITVATGAGVASDESESTFIP